MVHFAAVLASAYAGFILYILWHWRRLPRWSVPPDFVPATRVTILVPARNEAAHIETCLNSLLAQRYPRRLTEIVVLDDHSTDDTATRVEAMRQPGLRLLRLADHPAPPDLLAFKKYALSLGVRHSRGELVVTTDADCAYHPAWLSLLVSRYQESMAVCLCGPVAVRDPRNILERFQALDLLGTALITGAGHRSGKLLLANGANMAFTRHAFEAVGGYAGIDQLASGDDLLLLEKLAARYPGETVFVKHPHAVVQTTALPDWTSFLRQRQRWASKTGAYRDPWTTRIWMMVGAVASLLLAGTLLLPWAGFGYGKALAVLWIGKAGADALLLREATRFAGQPALMRSFGWSQLLHVSYIPWVALLTLSRSSYRWKGRQVR